ncbi:hypothetical protein CC78DRAFT_584286 [Lojkania enalia]|uniref:Uncharacterized protein n=1 Tax=Lojkania enalia TaxID=147567 RepID=A0A9P4N6Q3_9PLEO|nr:hypothetical protein CC78DRAFT_584286 [Didymosphaeria enalia]
MGANLLKFPPEIFERIVHELVSIAGVYGTWQLRAVCKTFHTYIMQDICAEQPLSAFGIQNGVVAQGTLMYNILEANLTDFLLCKTRKPLDTNRSIPSTINSTSDYLLNFTHYATPQEQYDVKTNLAEVLSHEVLREHTALGTIKALAQGDGIAPGQEEVALADHLAGAVSVGIQAAINNCLQNGGKIWKKSVSFGYPLTVALRYGPTAVDWLLGAIPARVMKATEELLAIREMFSNAICSAFEHKKLNMVRHLLHRYAQGMPRAPKWHYNHWLNGAIESRNEAIVKQVLNLKIRSGAKVNWNHFENACRVGYAPTLRLLLQDGKFDFNRTYYNTSPLTRAVEFGHVGLVRELLAAGADPNGYPNALARPLEIAIKKHLSRTIILLLDYGASYYGYPCQSDEDDRTENSLLQLAHARLQFDLCYRLALLKVNEEEEMELWGRILTLRRHT